MSLSKSMIVRDKDECVRVLSEALPDVTVHVLKLIAEYVHFRELLPLSSCAASEEPSKIVSVCVLRVQSTRCCSRRSCTRN